MSNSICYEYCAGKADLSLQRVSSALSKSPEGSTSELSNYYSERNSAPFNAKLALFEAVFGISFNKPAATSPYQYWVKDTQAKSGIVQDSL